MQLVFGDEDKVALLYRIRAVLDEVNPLARQQVIDFIVGMEMVVLHRVRPAAFYIFHEVVGFGAVMARFQFGGRRQWAALLS